MIEIDCVVDVMIDDHLESPDAAWKWNEEEHRKKFQSFSLTVLPYKCQVCVRVVDWSTKNQHEPFGHQYPFHVFLSSPICNKIAIESISQSNITYLFGIFHIIIIDETKTTRSTSLKEIRYEPENTEIVSYSSIIHNMNVIDSSEFGKYSSNIFFLGMGW